MSDHKFSVTSVDKQDPDSSHPSPRRTGTVVTCHELPSSSVGSPDIDEDVPKFTAHVLPPCRVCGAKATGFHYGVNTCEACKGFYHRSLTRHGDYVCLKNSKCEVRPGRRNSCSYCRYQRCLQVGMSRSSIKTGRYTYEKRTKDILELQHMKKAQTDQHVNAREKERRAQVEVFMKEIMHNKDKLIESMMKTVHRNYNPDFREEDVEKGRTRLKCIVPQDDSEHCMGTGELLKKWMDALESTTLKYIINFIKSTPGFKQIEVSDQIKIIKASLCEVWMVGRHYAFNTQLATFTSMHGIKFDLREALGDDMTDALMAVITRLQGLKLSEEETFLLMLYVVFTTDRCELEDTSKVSWVNEQLLQALLHTIGDKYPPPKHNPNLRFAHITACLTGMRSVSEMYHTITKQLVSTSADIPPLFWELISLS